jgi:hypothetical protein
MCTNFVAGKLYDCLLLSNINGAKMINTLYHVYKYTIFAAENSQTIFNKILKNLLYITAT